METVLSLCALAKLAGLSGPVAMARYAAALEQKELRALGAWRNPDALAGVLREWAAPRWVNGADAPALAADGKRLRGANRQADGGDHFETVTLATHDGRPVASRCGRDEGGELAALRALREDVDLKGRLLTLDALQTTHDPRHRPHPRRDARCRLPALGPGERPRHLRLADRHRLERRGHPRPCRDLRGRLPVFRDLLPHRELAVPGLHLGIFPGAGRTT